MNFGLRTRPGEMSVFFLRPAFGFEPRADTGGMSVRCFDGFPGILECRYVCAQPSDLVAAQPAVHATIAGDTHSNLLSRSNVRYRDALSLHERLRLANSAGASQA